MQFRIAVCVAVLSWCYKTRCLHDWPGCVDLYRICTAKKLKSSTCIRLASGGTIFIFGAHYGNRTDNKYGSSEMTVLVFVVLGEKAESELKKYFVEN